MYMFVVEGDCRLCEIPRREHSMTGYYHFPICIIANLDFIPETSIVASFGFCLPFFLGNHIVVGQ